jgi:hypothetical protein
MAAMRFSLRVSAPNHRGRNHRETGYKNCKHAPPEILTRLAQSLPGFPADKEY